MRLMGWQVAARAEALYTEQTFPSKCCKIPLKIGRPMNNWEGAAAAQRPAMEGGK